MRKYRLYHRPWTYRPGDRNFVTFRPGEHLSDEVREELSRRHDLERAARECQIQMAREAGIEVVSH